MSKKQIFKLIIFIVAVMWLIPHITYCIRTNGEAKDRFVGFYAEKRNTIDAVIIGSSPVPNCIATPKIYGDMGITMYPLSTNMQRPVASKYLVEETFEALEAIEEGDVEHAKEELGDVIMNAVEIAALYEKQGKFSVDEVLDGAAEKLIRRHPHVFEKKEMSLDQLNVQWEKIKKSEVKKEKFSHQEKFAKMQKLLESIAPEYDIK